MEYWGGASCEPNPVQYVRYSAQTGWKWDDTAEQMAQSSGKCLHGGSTVIYTSILPHTHTHTHSLSLSRKRDHRGKENMNPSNTK